MVWLYKALIHCLFECHMQLRSPHSKQNTLMLKNDQDAVRAIEGTEPLLCEELRSSLEHFRWEKGHLRMMEFYRCLQKSR